MVDAFFQRQGFIIGGKVVGQILQQTLGIAITQHGWRGAHEHGGGAKAFEV